MIYSEKSVWPISLLFSASTVFYKSFRQVLTPVDNLQHLLRLPIFIKTRLVAFHLQCNKEITVTGFCQKEKSESAHDLDSLLAIKNNNCC